LKKAQMVPVASPLYQPDLIDIQQMDRGLDVTFLRDMTGERDDTGFGWQVYSKSVGTDLTTDHSQLDFDRADLVMQAAINGMGIGLGRTLLIEQDLELGFLREIGRPVEMEAAYWLVCKPAFANTERYERLKDWLILRMK